MTSLFQGEHSLLTQLFPKVMPSSQLDTIISEAIILSLFIVVHQICKVTPAKPTPHLPHGHSERWEKCILLAGELVK